MAVTVNYKSETAGRPIFGTWTHAEGAANESVAVAGFVFGGQVSSLDITGGADVAIRYSISRSTTTGISTITFHCSEAVTDGRFYFFVSSM